MSKILIIEDNIEVRENLAEILELDGYETVEAENGKAGVAKAKAEMPDLILCDVMMPELDGFGVLKILNGITDFDDIPFMFLTAKGDKQDFRKGMGLGADDFITKPFDDLELLQAIEMRLGKSKETRKRGGRNIISPLFRDDQKTRNFILSKSNDRDSRSFHAKDEIFHRNQQAYWLYYIESGLVKTTLINDIGKELITNLYGEGDFIGYIPAIQDGAHRDNAIAIEDTQLRLVSISEYKKLLVQESSVMMYFLKLLSNYSLFMEIQAEGFAYSSVRKKVANALLLFSRKTNSLHFVALREDLAGLAGTAKETLIRTLSDFRRELLIDIKEHEILILNKEELDKMRQ